MCQYLHTNIFLATWLSHFLLKIITGMDSFDEFEFNVLQICPQKGLHLMIYACNQAIPFTDGGTMFLEPAGVCTLSTWWAASVYGVLPASSYPLRRWWSLSCWLRATDLPRFQGQLHFLHAFNSSGFHVSYLFSTAPLLALATILFTSFSFQPSSFNHHIWSSNVFII